MNAEIWVTTEGTLTKIGFTRSFLERMTECWNILPVGKKFKKDYPLMMVETNDEVISVMSPVDGLINNFSDKALNFPDKLTETDVVVIMSSNSPDRRAQAEARPMDGLSQLRERLNAQLPAAPARHRTAVPAPQIPDFQQQAEIAWNNRMTAASNRWGARPDVEIDVEPEPF